MSGSPFPAEVLASWSALITFELARQIREQGARGRRVGIALPQQRDPAGKQIMHDHELIGFEKIGGGFGKSIPPSIQRNRQPRHVRRRRYGRWPAFGGAAGPAGSDAPPRNTGGSWLAADGESGFGRLERALIHKIMAATASPSGRRNNHPSST